MPVFHIHITGIVQGVGFRPFVHSLAVQMALDGSVRNERDGVHILCAGPGDRVHLFYQHIISCPPPLALITHSTIHLSNDLVAAGFHIAASTNFAYSDMLLTPDAAPCRQCREELQDKTSRRYQYPFTTCTNCGPRYSVLTALPYDRLHTTMAALPTCAACDTEYADPNNRRHHSQTNSCPDCAITMHLKKPDGSEIFPEETYIEAIIQALSSGKIVALKNTGGYLLLADACNEAAIAALRKRKHRPAKPFAVLYPNLDLLRKDVYITGQMQDVLQSAVAPIVLSPLRRHTGHPIASQQLAPGLGTLGVMLPSSPLLQLIADAFNGPLLATSGNLSGSPIIYRDEQAAIFLGSIADLLLSYDRDITIPQDDSVCRFTRSGQQILLRRGRGLAPNYYPPPFPLPAEPLLAMGAELKNAFAVSTGNNLFVSQFLGDQANLESQESMQTCLQQLQTLLQTTQEHILIDAHPGYAVSAYGRELAQLTGVPVTRIQHHEAHFAAVLGENGLLDKNEPVLGCIWDGAGWGPDEQIWGGELFHYQDFTFSRVGHFRYFPQLMGDKMSREPRLSALSLASHTPDLLPLLRIHFTDAEWMHYLQLLQHPEKLVHTSSVGRLTDGIACLLGLTTKCSYEGEAALLLESLAASWQLPCYEYYPVPFVQGEWIWSEMLEEIGRDILMEQPPAKIARKYFHSLAHALLQAAEHLQVPVIACSGGVFQNALLTDMILENVGHKQIFLHQQLSPNDECIGFGQIARYHCLLARENQPQASEAILFG